MKKLVILLLAAIVPLLSFGRGNTDPGVKWYSMEQAVKLNRENPRKIFIYIYSDNCGWCRRMAGNTFTNDVIAKYLNDNFYPVKINTDTKKDITVGSKTYKYVAANPAKDAPAYHEFVVFLLQGSLAYPAVAFLDKDLVYMGAVRGYRPPSDFEPLLHYIGDDAYIQNTDFEKYASGFNGQL